MTPEEKRQKQQEYYEANKEKILLREKEYREKNKNKINERKRIQAKLYREKNKDKIKDYYEANKETIQKYQKAYVRTKNYTKLRRENDLMFKLTTDIRSQIGKILRSSGFKKLSKTEQILGCTFYEFKLHLESKFEDWMTWENKGHWNGQPTEINTAWDVDHIIPISSATCEADIIKLNHYTNLQPLCSYTNRYIKKDQH